MRKCHRCGNRVDTAWIRGQLTFCSDRCREQSKNEGEPCDGWHDDGSGELVYAKAKPKGEA